MNYVFNRFTNSLLTPCATGSYSHEFKLIRKLFRGYDTTVRPRFDSSDTVTVEVRFSLQQIYDLVSVLNIEILISSEQTIRQLVLERKPDQRVKTNVDTSVMALLYRLFGSIYESLKACLICTHNINIILVTRKTLEIVTRYCLPLAHKLLTFHQYFIDNSIKMKGGANALVI